jgi:heat shock protein HtpX
MALSRTREFEADRVGVQLVEDPYGLISALEKLDHYHKGIFSRFFLVPWKFSQPSLLQTHPPTRDRIERLLSMTTKNGQWLAQTPWQRRAPHRKTPYSWIYSDR